MREYRETNSLTQAVILCGGKGTRLWPVTKNIPKPLLRINNTPFLEYLIKNLSRQNIKNITLICSYKYEKFKKKYHKKILFGAYIECFNEGKAKGTGGGLKLIKNKLGNYFTVINGDTFFDINIHDLFKNFKKKKYLGIIATTINNNRRFGYLYQRQNKKFVNAGIYIFSKKIFKLFEKKEFISLESDIFPLAIKKKLIQFNSYTEKKNKFIDIGIHKDLKKSPGFIKKAFNKPAIFLDRDGVINKDLGYVHKIEDFKWMKDIKTIIKYFNDKLFYVIVLTNQSGIGRGYYSLEKMEQLHSWINASLNKNGSFIDKFYYSPYFKFSKKYNKKKYLVMRKPNNGMIKKACNDWNINIKKSLFIGDQISDFQLAKSMKLKYYMVQQNNLKKIFSEIKKLF